MNDHEAVDAISKAIDDYCDGKATQQDTLNRIARTLGANTLPHAKAKEGRGTNE